MDIINVTYLGRRTRKEWENTGEVVFCGRATGGVPELFSVKPTTAENKSFALEIEHRNGSLLTICPVGYTSGAEGLLIDRAERDAKKQHGFEPEISEDKDAIHGLFAQETNAAHGDVVRVRGREYYETSLLRAFYPDEYWRRFESWKNTRCGR